MAVNYNQVIQDSRAELKQCVGQRDFFDKRITELSIALKALVRFVPEEAHREQILQEVKNARRKSLSLPEAIFGLLCRSEEGMNASQIREQLEQSGFDIEEYSQPLGAVMTAAQRLVDDGKLDKDKTEESGVIFRKADIKRGSLAKLMGIDVAATETEHPMQTITRRPKGWGERLSEPDKKK